MKKFLLHLLKHGIDIFFLFWCTAMIIWYKCGFISFETTVLATINNLTCYLFCINLRK